MAKIITETLKKEDNTVEYVYPRTYALAVFLNNGETSVLDTIGDGWNKGTDKNLKNCSDDIKSLISKVSDLEGKIASLTSNLTDLTSRISNLESKSNS